MRPVPYNVTKFWPMLKECNLATLTCLNDSDFYRDWWKHTFNFFSYTGVFVIRLFVTLTFPLSALLLTLSMLWSNRKAKASREKAKQQIDEHYGSRHQKI